MHVYFYLLAKTYHSGRGQRYGSKESWKLKYREGDNFLTPLPLIFIKERAKFAGGIAPNPHRGLEHRDCGNGCVRDDDARVRGDGRGSVRE